jgi:hypothetical protein
MVSSQHQHEPGFLAFDSGMTIYFGMAPNNERLDLIEIEAPGQPSPRTAHL